MYLQEEYNRSAFDSEDTTPENEVNQDIIDDENVENSWTIELNLMTILEKIIWNSRKVPNFRKYFVKKKWLFSIQIIVDVNKRIHTINY